MENRRTSLQNLQKNFLIIRKHYEQLHAVNFNNLDGMGKLRKTQFLKIDVRKNQLNSPVSFLVPGWFH